MLKSRNRTYCCVFGCINNNSIMPDLSLFSVPNEPERRLQWLKLIGREDIINATYSYRVCEEHFRPDEVLAKATRKILKRNAIPSLRLPQTDEAQESPEEEAEVSVKPDIEDSEVTVKQEIEDSFSEHEEDVMVQIENRKRMMETPQSVPAKIVKKDPPEVLTVEIERERCDGPSFPVDFMKTVLSSQKDILTILKSQVLLQDPDADLMKFLRLMGTMLQRLNPAKRKRMQHAIVELMHKNQ